MSTLEELAAEADAVEPRSGGMPLAVIGVLWGIGIVLGMAALFVYSSSPGRAADAPARWPDGVTLERADDGMTLVVVAHPHCSCTRATISELAGLMSRLDGRVQAYVLFVLVDGAEEGWERTDLYRSASIIDGVTVVTDEGGEQARRFGAWTSGQTYLFDRDGALAFHGGITPTRSHVGDSVGRRRILQLVRGEGVERDRSSVFGCSLDEAEAESFWLPALRWAGSITEEIGDES